MDITKNIYRYALEEASKYIEDDGITYNELISILESKGFKPHNRSFMIWFFDSFIVIDTTITGSGLNTSSETLIKQLSYTEYDGNTDFDSLRNKKCYLKAEGVMRLMEYIELEDARKQSFRASKQAKMAIYISIVGLVLNIIFSLMEIVSDRNPKKELGNTITLEDSCKTEKKIINHDTISSGTIQQIKLKQDTL